MMSSRVCGFILLLSTMSAPFSQAQPFRVSLDGEWLFMVDSSKVGVDERWYLDRTDRSAWQRVQTPRYWEGYPGLANYDGWGWFARRVILPPIPGRLSLHFAGVDDDAVVWVNGMKVGGHSGYSDPFLIDVSGAVHTGENAIVVLVKDYGGGGGIYKPVTLIETRLLDDLLKSEYFGKPALKSADWVRDAAIYCVYLRSFSHEGTCAGLEKSIPQIKNLGATVLWLMPIHPVGMKNRKGSLGSPYAVRDYYGINPEFGTMDDFQRLLRTVHRNGMKLIIDLVANHTSWDSKLIAEHPEWFTHDASGKIVSPNADWTDVADLDYSQPALRRYMIDMMRWWVKDVGIDGFRCDVAELVPTDFWNDARRELNRIKPVMMLSEGSLPEQHMRAFDLTYSWNIYDALDPLLKGKRPVALIDQILKNENLQFPAGSLQMRFTTNHDKNAWDSPAVLKFGADGLKLATVLVNTLPGVPMLYNGEEVANDKRLSLFEKVDIDWTKPREMEQLWKALFMLRGEHKALSRGQMIRVSASGDTVLFAFFRVAGSDRILVVLNFSAETTTAQVEIPFAKIFPGNKSVELKDVFSGKRITLVGTDGAKLKVTLEPRGYKLFVVQQK